MAELLDELLQSELPKLDSATVAHGPTIGDMYEGLATKLLLQAIPDDIQVVTGFATDGYGHLSGQLDCMVVRGEGERVPYTDSYVWNVSDIIAVVEVKKNLHKQQIKEAWSQLLSVKEIERQFREQRSLEAPDEKVDIDGAARAFAETTHQIFPGFLNVSALPEDQQMIWNTLFVEQFSIVRIVLGMHGFQSETAFRRAIVNIFRDELGESGYGPGSLPQLIISGGYSLVKANGRPYSSPLVDGKWPFCFSSSANPLLLLLELIWTRLGELYDVTEFWGEDLELEVARALLFGKGTREGWHLSFADPSDEELIATPAHEDWSPAFVSAEAFVVINELCRGREVHVDDRDLVEWLGESGIDPRALQEELVGTALVAMRGTELVLISRNCQCVILPTGSGLWRRTIRVGSAGGCRSKVSFRRAGEDRTAAKRGPDRSRRRAAPALDDERES